LVCASSRTDGFGTRRATYSPEAMLAIPFMEFSAPAVEAALDTSPDAFRAFYEEALPRVYGYFLHRCGSSVPVAEDLTQDTFLAAVTELKKGKRVVTPIAWIYGIARHKLMDHYRAQERSERGLALTGQADEIEDEVIVPDEEEARERATSALASVAASQRAALVLCYVDGFSVREAAGILGKGEEAVESLLARGRASFKRAYLEERA
jgi:RNA polymerase sigma-70 factor, ECF subfamily